MKLQSTATLRAQFNKTQPDKPSMKEQLLAQQHRRAHAVIEWLRENWDGTTIVLPLPVNLSNRPMHFRVLAEVKNQYYSHCDLLKMARLLPLPPDKPPDVWRIAITVYSVMPMDNTNAYAAVKWPEDYLKVNGWCIDDNEKHLEIVSFKREIDRKVPRIEFRTVR